MKNIKIGGVPEHFNLPWYLTLRDKSYFEKNINLRWHDFFGGTGQMCKALRNKDIDMAVILTEGIIKDYIVEVFLRHQAMGYRFKTTSYVSMEEHPDPFVKGSVAKEARVRQCDIVKTSNYI